MDPLSHINPATHTIVYKRARVAVPSATNPHSRFYWHICIMNDDGEIETAREDLLWEEAEHFILKWYDQFRLPIFQRGSTPDQLTEGI